MTPATSWRGSTTRPGTCAGPSGATWDASSTCSPARTSRWSPWSARRSRSRRRPPPTRTWPRARCRAWACCCEYPEPETPAGPPATSRLLPGGQPATPRPTEGQLAVGFIGAGSYATSMLLPHLAGDPAVRLAHVATNRSLSAVNAQQRFSFGTASTSADAVLEDASLDVIFVVTRHHTHAELVCRALETGKAVFVEKPLALTREEVERILGGHREDRQRPPHGRVQPPVRAAADGHAGPVRPAGGHRQHAVPGQRRAARRHQLVPQRRAGRVAVHRRGRPFHRHAELVGGQPAHGGLRGLRRRPGGHPGDRALRQRGDRDHQLSHHRQPAVPEGDPGRRGRRVQRPARQLRQRQRLDRPEADQQQGAERSGQGPARGTPALHRSLPGRHRDADPARLPHRHHESHDRGRGKPGQRRPERV